jgi:hypothetical protein
VSDGEGGVALLKGGWEKDGKVLVRGFPALAGNGRIFWCKGAGVEDGAEDLRRVVNDRVAAAVRQSRAGTEGDDDSDVG